jgi:pyruvate carboxylase
VGDVVEPGARVAGIEAMKMEAPITSVKGGTVARVAIGAAATVEAGDLIIELR